MPLKTNLNVSPYYNDYDETKNYHHVLFKPGFSVQNRELHELQSILQNQIERFGDNILVRGTIVEGCNFQFYNPAPYIKIDDTQTDGLSPTTPGSYVDYNLESITTGLKAYVLDYEDGFESTFPDLKTLYVKYLNSGANGDTSTFIAGETIQVYSLQRAVYGFSINNGGSGFTNSDTVVVTPSVVVNVTSGTFSNGDFINNGGSANLEIVSIDANTLAQSNQLIFQVKPRDEDLANADTTSAAWTFANNESIADTGATATGVINQIIGSSLEAYIRTNAVGTVTNVVPTNRGIGYTTAPIVTVRSIDNSIGVASLDIEAKNYISEFKVSTTSESVGNGYAFGVSDGIIYQKGYFIRVDNQRVTVSKYDTSPDNLSIGFSTQESIVTSDQDTDLLDNATGEPNELAPGADRLKLTPELVVIAADAADDDPEFFTLVEFSEGRAFRQNQTTQYNKINDELARRTKEESGNYVVDKFIVSTSSPANSTLEAFKYTLKVDPGAAYIDGYRITTQDTFSYEVDRVVETRETNQAISLNYGNYVVVNQLLGLFQYSTGDLVDLYDTATAALSNTAFIEEANTTPAGTKIGEARIRSMVPLNNVTPENPLASSNSQYRMYLFDVRMNAGRNFKDVKGLHYSAGTYEGLADVVTVVQTATNNQVAELGDTQNKKLLFYSGVNSIHNVNAISYTYRTINQTLNFSNNGILTYDISGTPDEFFSTSGSLSNSELQKIYVSPIGAHMVAADNLTGTVTANATANNLVGSGTDFVNELAAGDYVSVFANSGGGSDLRKVTKVVNATYVEVDAVCDYSNTSAVIRRTFPQNVPIPFGKREGLVGSVDANGNVLTLELQYEDTTQLDLGTTSTTNTAVGVNIVRTDAARKTKTPQRNKFVELRLANNADSVTGPWCLGVPDGFRLRNVYHGVGAQANTSDTNVTKQFYIDHNQNVDYYGLSYLYKKPKSSLSLDTTDYLLVEFDYFTESGAGGFFDTISYVSSNTTQRQTIDSGTLDSLGSNIHSFEIPQLVGDRGNYYDLINQFDFRPRVANTATPDSDYASAPTNPAETISFGNTADPANGKKFPLPDSVLTATVSQYLGRIDSVYLNRYGQFSIVSGKPASNTLNTIPPEEPPGTLRLMDLYVPPYPNLPILKSLDFRAILNTRVANIRYLYDRVTDRTIERVKSYNTSTNYEQPMGYTMVDINKLEKRISDLEYYMGLSLLESDLKDRVIPSSVDPALNRFKFGFFVDDFDTFLRMDTANPTFSAGLEEDDLVPPKMSWIASFEPTTSGDYIDFPLVSQLNSSSPANAIEPPCLPDTQIANTFAYRTKFNSAQIGNTVSSYVDNYQLEFAGGASEIEPGNVVFVNSTATLYFYNYNTETKIEVYQGTTLIANSGAAVALTDQEKIRLTSDETSQWFNDQYDTFGLDVQLNGDYAAYMGKITFTHNPNLGRNYTIRAYKGNGAWRWRYALEYPIDRATVGCPPPPPGEPGAPGLPGTPGAPATPPTSPGTVIPAEPPPQPTCPPGSTLVTRVDFNAVREIISREGGNNNLFSVLRWVRQNPNRRAEVTVRGCRRRERRVIVTEWSDGTTTRRRRNTGGDP